MKIEEYLQKKYSKSTLASNLYNIKRFTDYYQNKAETATYTEILNYIAHLRKNYDLHPKTLRHCLYAVKIYFNYLLEIGKRKDHPCSELFLKDKINKQIQVDNLYSSETLENFLKTFKIKRKERLKRRNEVIITLLIYQALTVSEISNLEVENIDLESGEIQIKSGHHQQKRKLPLQAKQILLFYNYLEKERKELLLFNKENPVISYLILGQYGEKINPHTISKMINEYRKPSEKLQPMKIRQSVIANLLKKENDTRIVQVFSGHRRASTTIQYKQTELEALQNAVNQYHPIR
ncbi:tyrosine-type recombinase/integrase [Flavobacterium psychrophilum]|uniref:tyrosine-type recombinase/integrase n=1 Tax=Flavobacterium psychrophilum TaxID=96345 RepID=UPI000B7C5271|nr:tyrosine-type recombinase/integrase [Flavobacterium psychrophilum]EKT3967323.1 tyrosine-type recombinase/integrase [Flavobacterium psychrophilum]MCB6231892.1 tyrosine-type recombinase/integrase [Flavobacterium psychrophilum]MCB6231900.1 tyrosine-type recombinase/integrase [Flavobacterium psychrophilum]MEB3380563.1 tyrosine-type recombinase/integrase [Flavobacterium psychrophilum]SNA66157.1 putative Phage integrase family protein [Flavobacterium psychrophilum]